MLAKFVTSLPTGLSNWITKTYFQVALRNQRSAHSVADLNIGSRMDVKVLPALEDNYMYLIIDKATSEAAVVDPVAPQTVLQEAKILNLNLTKVLTTHHHWDHAGGNSEMKARMPSLEIYGGDKRIGALTHLVEHDTKFNIGRLNVQCLSTPCHTSGHICYFVSSSDRGGECALFSGDTLFLGGCGRFFEGTAAQMYNALINILSCLPADTKVYCGHEYSLANLKFAATIEPGNPEILKKIEWSVEKRRKKLPTVPSTIREEKAYNPFMRVQEPTVTQHTGVQDPVTTLHMIRCEKDNFYC